jgi:hypothetical protein
MTCLYVSIEFVPIPIDEHVRVNSCQMLINRFKTPIVVPVG